ncbi:hypothetical protein Q3G72_010180 [Acer saccharum]|nr:hypothetical protein Q3G72_010180 [Acer saccharum]
MVPVEPSVLSEWYFNYMSSTGSSELKEESPNEWDGDYEVSQKVIQKVIKDLGFVAHDID